MVSASLTTAVIDVANVVKMPTTATIVATATRLDLKFVSKLGKIDNNDVCDRCW